MKLAILDSGLINKTGHHYNHDKAIYDEAKRRGWDVELYTHVNFKEFTPYFNDYLYSMIGTGSPSDIIDNYYRKGQQYQANIEADVVFVPTGNHFTTCGLANSKIKAEKIVTNLCLPGWHNPLNDSFTLEAIFYQHAIRKAKSRYHKIDFYTYSPKQAEQLKEITGEDINVVDSFIPYMGVTAQPNKRLKLGYFGHNNHVKRGYMVANIIKDFPDVDFVIHENPVGSLRIPDGLSNVNVFQGEMSSEVYSEYINVCDIILMPYDPMYYKDSISNILLEALVLGKMVVVPHDTYMQKFAADSGVAFWKESAFPEAVRRAINTHDKVRPSLIEKAPIMQKRLHVSRFINDLIGFA